MLCEQHLQCQLPKSADNTSLHATVLAPIAMSMAGIKHIAQQCFRQPSLFQTWVPGVVQIPADLRLLQARLPQATYDDGTAKDDQIQARKA